MGSLCYVITTAELIILKSTKPFLWVVWELSNSRSKSIFFSRIFKYESILYGKALPWVTPKSLTTQSGGSNPPTPLWQIELIFNLLLHWQAKTRRVQATPSVKIQKPFFPFLLFGGTQKKTPQLDQNGPSYGHFKNRW